MVEQLLEALGAALLEPLAKISDPSERIYWPCLAASLAIVLAYGGLGRRRPRASSLGTALGAAARRWWHPSSRLDVQLLFANAVLRPVLAGAQLMSAASLALGVVEVLDGALGVRPIGGLSDGSVVALYSVTLFVVWDATRYLLHRWLHTVPALWELHKLHHSAEVLTPLSLYRAHPVEALLARLRAVLVTGLIAGIFFHLFRSRAVQAEILGVSAIGFVFNMAGANLRHAHTRITYGPLLERLLISPAQHQLHHSPEPGECHSNLGTWLAIWDRLGGTLILARDRCPERFGLRQEELNHDPHDLVSALLDPLGAAALRLVPSGHSADDSLHSTEDPSAGPLAG